METRSTDSLGRVSLPQGFANTTVIVERVSETEIRIRKAAASHQDHDRFPEETPIVLSDRQREAFLRQLDHPPEPNAALRKLMAGTDG